GLGKAENTQVIESYGKDWSERHPLCPPPQNNADDKSKYNPVGEDFLYMHREMIHALRAEFLKKNLACVKGWSSIDELDSPKWKPPGAAHDAKTKQALDLFKSWDRYFQDRSNLKQISLSQLGWALEFTIHNNLHMRFAEDRPAPQFRSAKADDDGAQIPYNGVFAKGWKYDDPAYNWLADPYGAAVNPIFWKIHGYVDHLIDLWLEANGYKTVALDCHGASDCYQWRGTWTGSTPLMAPESSQPKGLTLANGNNADKLFNQSRLKLQLIGVVHDSDFNRMKGPIHGGQPEQNDPLSVAKQKLCESSN
ncbi:MAG: tyrosinase family protein, partial [Pseudobdellovibrio sp.]